MLDLLKQAYTFYEDHEYDSALKVIAKLLKSNPVDDIKRDALYLKGDIYFSKRDNPRTAKKCLHECLDMTSPSHEKYFDICFMLGDVYFKGRQSDYDKALAFYEKIPESNNNYFTARQYIAAIYSTKKEYQQAFDVLETTNTEEKYFGRLMHSMADIYAEMGDFDKRIACFDRVPASDPYYGTIQSLKGSGLKKRGDIDGALACFHLMLEHQVDEYTAMRRIAEIHLEQGKKQEAINTWRKAKPENQWVYGEALCNIAKIYLSDRDYENALNVLDIIPHLSERFILALELKYEIYKAQKLKELEVKYYKWLFIAIGDKYKCRLGYDHTYGDITENDELEFWDSIDKNVPGYEYVVLQKALIHKKIGKNEKANNLISTIPQEKRDEIVQRYNFDFKEIEQLES